MATTNPASLFTKEQKTAITEAIRQAEAHTSAEIRVHIESKCPGSVLDRAVEVFSKLKMDRTADRNGVLVYVCLNDRKTAIIGDVNINKYVEKDFWQECYADMAARFSRGEFTEGICSAIGRLENELIAHFPHRKDDVNELPDDISFGA